MLEPFTRQGIEGIVVELWSALLDDEVRPDDDFFDVGGDSLLVVEFVIAARERGLEVRAGDVFEARTAARLAGRLHPAATEPARAAPLALPGLRPSVDELWRTHLDPWSIAAPPYAVPLIPGTGNPLFVVHWGNGAVRFVAPMAAAWAEGRPMIGFEAPGYRGRIRPLSSIEALAERYVQEVLQLQPQGPYLLSGICHGAVVAFEMGRQLRAGGVQDVRVAMLKPSTLVPWLSYGWGLEEILRWRVDALPDWIGVSRDASAAETLAAMRRHGWYDEQTTPDDLPRLQVLWAALALSLHHYTPRTFAGPVLSVQDVVDEEDMKQHWAHALPDVQTVSVSFGEESALPLLRAERTAEAMREWLSR
jgi:thioesterase domain-containing protein/acyl carrier protein